VAAAQSPHLVVPSELPWPQPVGEPPEERVFWLCDAMGAKDLEWRAGSVSGTSPDGGRVVEATFHLPSPDGELRTERWWLQCKGRSATVEPAAVQSAVLAASANSGVAAVIVATNSRYSNGTRDWVAEWNRSHPRPFVRLWDRSSLERMLVQHPSVVARVAPQALSIQGSLAALVARFRGRFELPPDELLARLWDASAELAVDAADTLALLAGEFANGDPVARPWLDEMEAGEVLAVLVVGLLEAPALVWRATPLGVDTRPLARALALALGAALGRTSPRAALEVLQNPLRYAQRGDGHGDPDVWPEELRALFITPVLAQLRHDVAMPCVADCVRISTDVDEPARLRGTVLDWLDPLGFAGVEDDRVLTLEKLDAPCRAGLELDEDRTCPLFTDEPWKEALPRLAAMVRGRLSMGQPTTVARPGR